MRKVALLSVLLFFMSIPAFAEDQRPYFILKLGTYLPQANDVYKFDNALYGEVVFGEYFIENFAAEGGVGYTKPGTASFDLNIIPITYGLKGFLPMGGKIEPFAGGGVG